MRSPTLVLIAALAALIPDAGRADDGDWGARYPDEWSDVRPVAGYDVSVDVQGGVTIDTFHGALAPYGQWVVVANYGRVWRPNVPAGWRPYYYGRWEWTNEGWLWVSDEPWGWAAYHYGRWTYDPYYGWIWVPGTEWAPAWVAWRSSGDVIGWAPLAPGYSVYVSSYPFIDFWWTFVPCVRFVSVPVYSVAYAPHFARRHFHATAPAPARPPRPGGRVVSAPAWGGPAPRLIEERAGRPVTAARIVAAPAPGGRARPGEIAVYRPDRRPAGNGFSAAPGRSGEAVRAGPQPGGNGRGPGAVAAPGWGGRAQRPEHGRGGGGGGGSVSRPAPRGGGEAPGAVVAPGPRAGAAPREPRGGGAQAAPRQGGEARGAVVAPAPRGGAASRESRGGGAPPAQRGGGGGRSERSGARR